MLSGPRMNLSGNFSSSKSIDLLSVFRGHAFRAFDIRAELSDALWFAIWSEKSVGGRLARVLLNQSAFGMVKLIIVVALETLWQGFVRCRKPVFVLPSKWIKDQTSVVLQTWHDFKSAKEMPAVLQDKFFGDFFAESHAKGEISLIEIITDDVQSGDDVQKLMIGRASLVTYFDVKILLRTTRVIIMGVPSLVRMFFSVSGLVQKLGCIVVFFAIGNQRSRHTFELYQFLQTQVVPLLRSQKNPATLYCPYESQPEQNALAAAWRDGGGISVGYIHSTMLTFPSHYLRPCFGAVDDIWHHGFAYHDVLKLLGWSTHQIKKIKTLRFSKSRSVSQEPYPGAIYLPYCLGNLSFALTQIKLGVQAGVLSINSLKPHPVTGILKSDRNRFQEIINQCSKNLPQIITVGPVSVPLEEIERGCKIDIIHVPTSNAPWDSYCLDLWSNYLISEPIAANIVAYQVRLKLPGSFIDFHG
jgi:hypothetical protein